MNEELKDQLEGFIDDLQLILNRYRSNKFNIEDVIKEMNATGQDLMKPQRILNVQTLMEKQCNTLLKSQGWITKY